MGGTVDFQMISTPSSFIPRALNSKVKVHVLGKSLNLFEVSETAVNSVNCSKIMQNYAKYRVATRL